jgi:hypothetical protein
LAGITRPQLPETTTRYMRPFLLIFLAICSICAAHPSMAQKRLAASENAPGTPKPPDHYLMLVNTAVASYMTEDKFRQFDKSPYDGLAVAFLHAYDTSAPPSVTDIERQIASWKKFTSKEIWPWVYVNRIIGMSASEKNPHSDTPYFRRIVGADLDDKYGALSEFLLVWRNSLVAARDEGIPGIVCDLEFYNYYKQYDISELASQTGRKPPEVVESLEKIGARMADSAAETYPNATIWLLFTGLTHAGYKKLDGIPYYPSPTYISIGLLDEIVKRKFSVKVLAGGEGSIGYCHESLDEFRSSIQKRQADLAADLQKYSGVLELAGTLALWSDRAAKKDWLNQGACQASDANTIEDLQPYIELLMKTYRYNWLYGTSEGNYLPFSPAVAPRFDAVIEKAKARTLLNSRKPS